MDKNAVYFFAEFPIELAAWAGLASIIREVRPDIPLELIYPGAWSSSSYSWDTVFSCFDRVHKINGIWWPGNWRAGITGGNLFRALFKGFPKARRVLSDLKAIPLQPNSLAFVFNGWSLNQMLFLKRVKLEAEVDSVLITEERDDSLLSDYTLNYSQSYFMNLYLHFFGTAYLDVYWMRTDESRTAQREYRFRNKPADFVFTGTHAPRFHSLKPGHVFFPFYRKGRASPTSTESVVLFGMIFEWEPALSADLCYQRYNELIELIREKHPNTRLIYKPHPGQTAQQRDKVDLKGFEIISDMSSEELVMKEQSITTAYAFISTSSHTAACLGIRSHFLYPLFDNKCVPDTMMQRYESWASSEVIPEMCIRSIDAWMSGKNDYNPTIISDRVLASTIKMLNVVGFTDIDSDIGANQDLTVIPKGQWGNSGVYPWPLRRLGAILR